LSEVAFSLATRDDDAGIRRLLATSAMPGRIRVRFEREPDYFAGCEAMGSFTQVLVAKDEQRVVGVACRAVQKMFINGVAEDVGYLGQLRVDAAYRGRLLVARGFRRLRELHADGRVQGYITTIVDGNAEAEGVLVRRARSAMPRYRFLDKLFTLAIPVSRRSHGAHDAPHPNPLPTAMKPPRGEGTRGKEGSREDRNSSSFSPPQRGEGARRADEGSPLWLEAHAPSRNLFPAGEPQGEIVAVDGGVAALNDQRSYKQTVIDGYAPVLKIARPLYNLVGRIRLPRPGSTLNHAYVTHFCVAGDEPCIARQLIEELLHAAERRNLDHILLGFTAGDPLLRVARTFRPVEYESSIYTVAWNGEDDLHDRLDSRPRALDISAL
jgi:predicted N-acetyltransferase YhbS